MTSTKESRKSPTREEINALDDIDDVRALREEVMEKIDKIEMSLKTDDRGGDWRERAQMALNFSRNSLKYCENRIASLKRGFSKPVRPDEEISPLTLEILHGLPPFDIAGCSDISVLKERREWVRIRREQLMRDRADEISIEPGRDRDEAFLALTKIAATSAGQEMEAIRLRVQELSREDEAQNAFYKAFYEAAKARLTDDDLDEISDAVIREFRLTPAVTDVQK